MIKRFKIILGGFFCLIIAIAAYFFLHHPEEKTFHPILEKVQIRTIRTEISASGTLEPVDQVEVGTQVSGDIAKIHVDFNSNVKKGQVLAELDKSKLEAVLQQAEISLRSAQNDYQYKKSVYERTKKLAEAGSASTVDLETAEYNLNAAALAVERSKGEVSQARLNVRYCIIKSPIAGVVLERSVDVGQTVAASMSAPTLFILAKDLRQMRVMASVDEADIGAVRTGQRVEFNVDAFLDETFYGTVQEVRLNPVTTSNVVTYTVVISAENPDKKLLPGMTATCAIITAEAKDVLSVSVKATQYKPSENIVQNNLSTKTPSRMKKSAEAPLNPKSQRLTHNANVWLYTAGQMASQPVQTGLSDGVYIQIINGLSAQDAVIVSESSNSMPQKEMQRGEQNPFMPTPPGRKRK